MKFGTGDKWNGNKKGRPKGLTARDFITEGDIQASMKKLLAFTNDTRKEIAFKAVELVLAYGLGKPTQAVENTHSGEVKININWGDRVAGS
jgi:hypothetical protein